MQGWARVAELTKAKNREGGFVAQCAAGSPFLLSEGMDVRFVPPRLDVPRGGRVECVDLIDAHRGYVMFDTVRDLSMAEQLVGCAVLAREDDLPRAALSEGDGLAGFSVHDGRYGVIGTVSHVRSNPAHPLLAVDTEKGEVLIPCVDEFIVGIDERERVVHTAVPSGLLEL